jgi:hypothetical protein
MTAALSDLRDTSNSDDGAAPTVFTKATAQLGCRHFNSSDDVAAPTAAISTATLMQALQQSPQQHRRQHNNSVSQAAVVSNISNSLSRSAMQRRQLTLSFCREDSNSFSLLLFQ